MNKPFTLKEVMDRIYLNNKDKGYDYSKLLYRTTSTDVIVTCKKHGDFTVELRKHLSGSTCTECISENKKKHIEKLSLRKKKTREKEIKSISKNYGKNINVELNEKAEVIIKCNKHGTIKHFDRNEKINSTYTPICKKCKEEELIKNLEIMSEEIMKKNNNILSFSIDKNHSELLCKRHGLFIKKINNEKSCRKCSSEKQIFLEINKKLESMNIKKQENIVDAIFKLYNKVNDNKYRYIMDSSQYFGKKEEIKAIAICKSHGSFVTRYISHSEGSKCPACSGKKRWNKKETLSRFRQAHGERYDYSKMKYINSSKKITIICKKHNKIFRASPSNHYYSRNGGCPECSESGFRDNLPGILYYLSVNNGQAYKIGITNHSVKERYSKSDFAKIEIIKEWKYEIGKEAREKEAFILKEYKHSKHNGNKLLENGNTELFNTDILLLDK